MSLLNLAAPRLPHVHGTEGISGQTQARDLRVRSTVGLPRGSLSTFGRGGARRMERHMIPVPMISGVDVVPIVAVVVHNSTGIRGLADGTQSECKVEWVLSLRLGIVDPPAATATSGSGTTLM